ncbi:MAG: alpha/beta hydrolase [Mucilaginibacter polytrichastri]|nr:alpha/beta hydrolase [Mucilaginibacter polytrichastri]
MQNENPAQSKPTIVFVHGLWADGSCWNKVIAQLQAEGYKTISAQNPTTTLADDVMAVQHALDRTSGPVILVGHSWGGFVITQFGKNERVKGLVYVAALAPDENETATALLEKAAPNQLANFYVKHNGFVTLSEDGMMKAFAQDLPKKEQMIQFATQTPAGLAAFDNKSAAPAWKSLPSWYVLAKRDETVNPDLQRLMSKRMKAKVYEADSDHVVMLSHPDAVLKAIHDAAKGG